ncbi:histamine N-methyltransferase-like [Brachionichthys hirsutus]|uniref:histamine N-methyltransferase-like n=1 Tax=Brachionichthys hirsutus TaxID=412623 RepID=UPI0036045A84
MTSQLKSLISDYSKYLRGHSIFLERSSQFRSVKEFIHNELRALNCIGNGKSHLNVIGVGSGTGIVDLEILSELHLMHPSATVAQEVVEPSTEQLEKYQALVAKTPGLDYVKFNWNKKYAEEIEDEWKEKKMTKTVDFIHMFQVLYYVKDPEATISFFRSLLNKNGKLVICILSDASPWVKVWQAYLTGLNFKKEHHFLSSGDVKRLLDSEGVSYQSYELQSQMDITECFTEGDEKGEVILDFLTQVLHFSKTAPPELKAGVMELLCHPDYGTEIDGRVMFNDVTAMIII